METEAGDGDPPTDEESLEATEEIVEFSTTVSSCNLKAEYAGLGQSASPSM